MGRSQASELWLGRRSGELDEFTTVHTEVGGEGPGRRHLTAQLNRGYLLALAAQFQGFCRDLHSEAAAAVVGAAPAAMQTVVSANLTLNRQLDRGNARAGALGSDFGRLDVDLWTKVSGRLADGPKRNRRLEQLMIWRNSIAHSAPMSQGDATIVANTRPTLVYLSGWRANLNVLANAFDPIVRAQVRNLTGAAPW